MKKVFFPIMLFFSISILLASCGSYYKITDPQSQKSYYTTDVDKEKSGAVNFTDEKTKEEVTIQNSEISEISKEEFKKQTCEE
nr:hypothetical protein [uncultured Desulfobacter sp.]